MKPTPALLKRAPSSIRRLPLTTKMAGKGFYKGTGTGSMGKFTKKGHFAVQWEKVRTYVPATNFSDVPLTPFVSARVERPADPYEMVYENTEETDSKMVEDPVGNAIEAKSQAVDDSQIRSVQEKDPEILTEELPYEEELEELVGPPKRQKVKVKIPPVSGEHYLKEFKKWAWRDQQERIQQGNVDREVMERMKTDAF